MWIFTTFGFFSIVQHSEQPGDLLVRARARERLVDFAERLRLLRGAGAPEMVPIIETPERDYPFRIVVSKTQAARVLFGAVTEINYPNFKDAVAAQRTSRSEQARALGRYVDALLRVWSIMRTTIDLRVHAEDAMKIFVLIPNEARRPAKLPHDEADHAVVDGACPKCKATPWGVVGSGKYPSKDDLA